MPIKCPVCGYWLATPRRKTVIQKLELLEKHIRKAHPEIVKQNPNFSVGYEVDEYGRMIGILSE